MIKCNFHTLILFVPKCFVKFFCPHHNKLVPIIQAIDQSNLIILASPVYVYHGLEKLDLGNKTHSWDNKSLYKVYNFLTYSKKIQYYKINTAKRS